MKYVTYVVYLLLVVVIIGGTLAIFTNDVFTINGSQITLSNLAGSTDRGSLLFAEEHNPVQHLHRGDVVIHRGRWFGRMPQAYKVTYARSRDGYLNHDASFYTLIHLEDVPTQGCLYSILGNEVWCADSK